jgi:glutathione peroxidase
MTDLLRAGLAFLGVGSRSPAKADGRSAWDFSFVGIQGKPMPLSDYRGKALLVVNTASQCGFTPQYKGLEDLFEKYRERGLMVLGVPCNDFGGQEPGDSGAISQFCEVNYRIRFPLTEKTKVAGGNLVPWPSRDGIFINI